jgi:hypothetical protein
MRGKLTVAGYSHKQVCSSENLGDNWDINRAWDDIRENIKISAQESLCYCESMHRKLWFDECSKLVDQRKWAKLWWLLDPSEVNEDNLSNVWQEPGRHFRNKEKRNI